MVIGMTEALLNKIRMNTEMISLDEDSESIYGKIAEAYKTEPAVVNTADFWNNVEKLDLQPKRDWRKYIKYGAAAFIGISLMGCLGQAPTPEPTHEPTNTPPATTITSVPSTSPPTVVPTTLPPVTVKPTGTPVPQLPKGCVIGEKKIGACYVGDFVGTDDPEWKAFLSTFQKELYDNDGSDLPFFQARFDFATPGYNSGEYYLLYGDKLPKFNDTALGLIKEIKNPTRDSIKNYVKNYGNNQIVVYLFGAEEKNQKYFVLFIGNSGVDYGYTQLDETATLTELKCWKYSKGNCDSIKLNPNGAAYLIRIPYDEGLALLNYLKS